jgi:hypothetical protein
MSECRSPQSLTALTAARIECTPAAGVCGGTLTPPNGPLHLSAPALAGFWGAAPTCCRASDVRSATARASVQQECVGWRRQRARRRARCKFAAGSRPSRPYGATLSGRRLFLWLAVAWTGLSLAALLASVTGQWQTASWAHGIASLGLLLATAMLRSPRYGLYARYMQRLRALRVERLRQRKAGRRSLGLPH